MKKIWFLGLLLLSASALYADEQDKLYFGLGVGNADYSQYAFNADDDLSLLAFGYEYSDFYSVEVGYMDLGTVQDRYFAPNIITITPDTLMVGAKGLTIAPAFEFDLSSHWSVSGRVGLSVMEVDKLWTGGTFYDESFIRDTGGTETEFFYGFRLQYQMNDAMSFEINWDKYEVESIDVDTVYAKVNFYY